MGARYLTDLADVCRRSGWPVIEVDGWPARARGSGGYNPGQPSHVMVHHTASGPGSDGWPDVNYCTFADSDAPLCNLYLARDGTVYVCAAGATNTNGAGADPCALVSDDSMNAAAIGIEAGNTGDGSEAWPPDQCAAYTALVNTLCAAYGIAPAQVHSHAEWAPTRKIDPKGPAPWGPGTWDMDAFRADLTGGPPPPPTIGDDMAVIIKGDGSDSYYAWNGVNAVGIPDLQWVQWGVEAGVYPSADPIVYPQGFIDQLVAAQAER